MLMKICLSRMETLNPKLKDNFISNFLKIAEVAHEGIYYGIEELH